MPSRPPQGGVFWAPSGGAVPSFPDVANARDMASLLRPAAARGLAADRHLAPSLGHLPLALLAHDVDTARNTLIADHSVAVAVSRRGHHGAWSAGCSCRRNCKRPYGPRSPP